MDATCAECGRALPEAPQVGRPRRFCSASCRSAARRARLRESRAAEAEALRRCATAIAGTECGRDARHTLMVGGRRTPVCADCYRMSLNYLMSHGVRADSVEVEQPDPVPASEPPAEAPRTGTRVLLIEDDDRVRHALGAALTRRGYHVLGVAYGREGLETAYAQRPDVVLLDLGLPDMDGYEVLRRMRGVSNVPIIVVSARGEINDRTRGLTIGADDYLVKPFDFGELLARIERTQRRRSNGNFPEKVYDDGLLRLDPLRREVTVAGEPVALTPTEFRLLETLVRNAGTVQPLQSLLTTAWTDPSGDAGVRVKFAVSRLRRKLGETPLGTEAIVSARGVGYLYRTPAAAQPPPEQAIASDRERIARDLHDVVIQRVFAIGMALTGVQRKVDEPFRTKLGNLVKGLDEVVRQIRRTIFSLETGQPGLREEVLDQIKSYTGTLGFEPRVVIDGPLEAVSPEAQGDLIATLSEALSNVVRHSGARSVEVLVLVAPNKARLSLSVVDSGVGPPAEYPHRGGLANMEQRAERWHGTFSLATAPSGGAELTWVIPLPGPSG